jgi:hypothetical protein
MRDEKRRNKNVHQKKKYINLCVCGNSHAPGTATPEIQHTVTGGLRAWHVAHGNKKRSSWHFSWYVCPSRTNNLASCVQVHVCVRESEECVDACVCV